MQPSVPNTNASMTMVVNISALKCGITKEGSPAGISPIRRILSVSNIIIDNNVTAIKATSCAGTYLRYSLGK